MEKEQTEERSIDKNLAVKVIGETPEHVTVAGWGVVFGGRDLEGDTFTKSTDFMLSLVPVKPVFYDHTLGDVKSMLGAVKSVEVKSDDGIDGLWIEAELERSQEYVKEVIQLCDRGVLGWSSGSVGHLVRRDQKSIKTWPVVEWSLTPTPAEPRTIGAQLLKAIADVNDQLQVLEQEPGDGSESTTTHVDAVEDCKIQNLESAKCVSEVNMTEQEQTEEVKTSEVKIDYDRIIAGLAEALKAEPPSTKRAEPLTAAVQLKIPKYSKDPETDAFLHYVKTGRDAGVYKAAMQEGTASEGGYLVPDDFYAKIIAKRDESSIVRQAGCLTINTSLDVVNIPVESTISSFTETAEEAAYSESEPTLGQVSITVHKATNLIKVSEELMADQAANLEGFLSEQLGRGQAAFENNRFLVGNGTTQAQGIYVGGTAALTSDYATTIGAAEIPELFSKLTEPYVPEAVWVMRWATYWNQINSLTGNPFQFMQTPAGGGWQYQLLGKRVLFSDQNQAFAASQKSMCVANFRYYAVVERQGLRIQRNPYLYMANGQVGLFSSFRQGGAVLQAEAFQYLTNHA